MSESAFIAPVSEIEPFVAHLRERYDPPARLGVPAHVTLLFPFASQELLTTDMLNRASAVATASVAFPFRLTSIRRFPGVVYLAPEPADGFVRLASGLIRLFPDYPPYGGEHKSVIPHVTVARGDDATLDSVEQELSAALGSQPVAATCGEFVLIENSTGSWKVVRTFRLGR